MNQVNTTGKRILLVEDEPTICRVCVKVLTADGVTIDLANNGEIAKDMLNKTGYDLCLFDIRTPGMNGMELYQYLKEEHAGMVNKVIFTTGDVLSHNIEVFLREANRPYLPKPFTPNELRAVVREALK